MGDPRYRLATDLNDLVRSPDGKVSEAKVFSVAFKSAMLWAFIQSPDRILSSVEILATFIVAMIAPDLLKKWLSMRAGIPEDKK